jgi:predicted NUDIX family NTP pyrophosphohydrolase
MNLPLRFEYGSNAKSVAYQMKAKQFAALPYRMRDNAIEILLITTRKKRRWSVPKGWPIKRKSPRGTASTEAFEEAGVRGSVGSKQIGQFKKLRIRKNQPVLCEVAIYPLRVNLEQTDWPEKFERNRIWVNSNDAAKLVTKPGLKRAIKSLRRNTPRQSAS